MLEKLQDNKSFHICELLKVLKCNNTDNNTN